MALPLAEAAVGWGLSIPGAGSLSAQASAPAPFGVFHDLRWLFVYNQSWWTFVIGLAISVAGRAAVTAAIVGEAWPAGAERPRPTFRVAYRRTLVFTAVAVLLFSPWALLLFGMAVVSLSWLFFTAVPPALVFALLLHHGAVTPRWWREAPSPRSAAWTFATFGVLMVDAALISSCPTWAQPWVAAVAGLGNAWLWRRVVRAVVLRPAHVKARVRPVAPIGVAAMFAVVVAGAGLSFRSVTNRSASAATAGPSTEETGRPVLVATGFESHWDGSEGPTLGPGFDEARFSYRGMGAHDRPLPYSGDDTQQSLRHLETLMAEQVDALHRRTRRPVAVVAESEGALVTKSYLLDHPEAPVDLVVMLSPLAHPGLAQYPPAGNEGWGAIASWGLQGVTDAITALSPFHLSPDGPLLRSMVDDAPVLQGRGSCRIRGVDRIEVLPLADSVTDPTVHQPGVQVSIVAAFHGGLLGEAEIRDRVRGYLHGDRPGGNGALVGVERLFSAVSSAWRVPGLPASVRSSDADRAASCRP